MDRETLKTKRGLKGIHRETLINHDHFLSCLYHNTEIRRKQNRMAYNQKRNQMDIIQQNKLALNPCYFKLYVNDDLVSISPLKIDGKLVYLINHFEILEMVYRSIVEISKDEIKELSMILKDEEISLDGKPDIVEYIIIS